MSTATLSSDDQVVALLCSTAAGTGGPRPLTVREWSDLRRLIHGSTVQRPGNLLGMRADEMRETLGIAANAAERVADLLARGGQLAIEVERLASQGISLLTRAHEEYPRSLRQRLGDQAPPVLYVSGRVALLNEPGLAVVGSRDASDEALSFAAAIGAWAARESLAIVSGAARGTDTVAMHGSLEADGTAIGFTVDPLERLVRRRELRVPLSEGRLVLVTPFHPSARWHAGNAMRRNRLIYSAAEAAIVVATAAGEGGTWAGAVENLKHHWTPLWVRDDGSRGARALMTEGARRLSASSDFTFGRTTLSEAPPTLLDEVRESAAPEPEPEVVEPPQPTQLPVRTEAPPDLLELAWPLLERYLYEPRTAAEVAEHFDLVLSQARAWLTRAEEDGRIVVRPRPKRYMLAGAAAQDALFESQGTAS